MALRCRRTNNCVEIWCLVASRGVDIWVSWTRFQKSNISWPQQPPTWKVLKFKMIFHDSSIIFFLFQNIKIKLNSRTPMTLESSAVIFQALKPLQPHWPHRPLQPRWPLQPQKPYFTKELPDSDGWIILGTKMTNSCQFLWNSSSKIQFFTDFSTFSAGGCWGQPMLLFWKLGQETQMSTPPEATRHHISTQLLVLLHLRAIYFSTFQYETPCSSYQSYIYQVL